MPLQPVINGPEKARRNDARMTGRIVYRIVANRSQHGHLEKRQKCCLATIRACKSFISVSTTQSSSNKWRW